MSSNAGELSGLKTTLLAELEAVKIRMTKNDISSWELIEQSQIRIKKTDTANQLTLCMICRKVILDNEEIFTCPTCNTIFHLPHLAEWLHIKGACPTCKTHIPLGFVHQRIESGITGQSRE